MELFSKVWGRYGVCDLVKQFGAEFSRRRIRAYLNDVWTIQEENERPVIEELMFQTLLLPCQTEKAFFICFDAGVHARMPLDHPSQLRNSNLPFPISFIYGDNDWSDSRGAREIVKANKFYASGES